MKANATAFSYECNDSFIDEIEVTSRLINLVLDMPVSEQLDLLNILDSTGYKGVRKQPRTLLKNPWVVMIDPEKKNSLTEHHIKDISRCGMLIETERTFNVGEKILLTFQMPASRKLFKIVGEVVRFQKNGIGVKFKRQFTDSAQS
ncbi:MAG: PilZ domain-containing protein [Desulfobacula sp.]|nr:PilZ domain-containing protein [Desulfobacula sp.]